ncbi:hypothetical protein J7E93_09530 [Streptomyces sp. ISL-36]|uniref:ATP-binding protein n=1 Tax=Streptomyces sp. ISL-36 TaxID=2819182 RepID=UPI001BEB5807|nr:hypothetical protein [Streptomyces sp. ISL-36]MBT2440345.1 hypothetical protein [Streptomyces sp. ISL-36]
MWSRVGGSKVPPPYGYSGSAPGVLVGRERESAELERLLAGHRLVTVTGGVGVGKSRLAVAAAAAREDGPCGRVVQVLRPGSGPGGAPAPGELSAAVAEALTDPPSEHAHGVGTSSVPRSAAARTLLVLDDVDPVHAECLGLVQRLLMAEPGLRVLVTCRRALGLGEERVLRLAPLRTAAGGGAGHGPAVELFLDRARAAVEGFAAEGPDLRAVAEICRSLEGSPLAIEMAAEQVARRQLDDLAEQLTRHQGWLTGGRSGLRRHRSLRAAIGSDYVLCERAVRVVWGRASVFAGSFAESAAVFLCAGGTVEPSHVPSCLAQLAAMGVLETVGDGGGPRRPRYRMSRAAREFGAERLREAGEFEVAAERRLIHCADVAAVAESLWNSGCQSQAVQTLLEEHEDLTAMLRYAVGRPDHVEVALETVVSLWFWWAVYHRSEEGRVYLMRLLPLCPPDSPSAVRALWLAAWLTARADPQAARSLLRRAWPAAVLAGDDATVGRVAHVEGILALREQDLQAAAEHFRQAADTTPVWAPGGPSPAISLAALAVIQAGFAPAAARRSARRALTQPGVREDAWATSVARYARAFVDHRLGSNGRAWRRAHRTVASLDPGLPAPHGAALLHELMADIEAGARGGPRLPSVAPGGTDEPLSAPAEPEAGRDAGETERDAERDADGGAGRGAQRERAR